MLVVARTVNWLVMLPVRVTAVARREARTYRELCREIEKYRRA